jgi:hypothetical protein
VGITREEEVADTSQSGDGHPDEDESEGRKTRDGEEVLDCDVHEDEEKVGEGDEQEAGVGLAE